MEDSDVEAEDWVSALRVDNNANRSDSDEDWSNALAGTQPPLAHSQDDSCGSLGGGDQSEEEDWAAVAEPNVQQIVLFEPERRAAPRFDESMVMDSASAALFAPPIYGGLRFDDDSLKNLQCFEMALERQGEGISLRCVESRLQHDRRIR